MNQSATYASMTIFTKLWAQFLVNGEEWWLTRLTPNSANDAACSGTLGFSNESLEQKLRRENPKEKYEKSATPALPLSAASPATRDNIPLWPVHNKPFQLNTHEISGVLRTFFHPNLCPQIRDRPGHRAGVPSGLSYRLTTACYRCSTCFTWWILSTATRSIYQFYPDV